MPRKKPGPRQKATFSRDDVERALLSIRAGNTLRKAANEFSVPKSTLQRYAKGTKDAGDLAGAKLMPNYANRKIFNEEIESELARYVVDCAQMGYGLDAIQVRQLAFQLAKKIPWLTLTIGTSMKWQERTGLCHFGKGTLLSV